MSLRLIIRGRGSRTIKINVLIQNTVRSNKKTSDKGEMSQFWDYDKEFLRVKTHTIVRVTLLLSWLSRERVRKGLVWVDNLECLKIQSNEITKVATGSYTWIYDWLGWFNAEESTLLKTQFIKYKQDWDPSEEGREDKKSREEVWSVGRQKIHKK